MDLPASSATWSDSADGSTHDAGASTVSAAARACRPAAPATISAVSTADHDQEFAFRAASTTTQSPPAPNIAARPAGSTSPGARDAGLAVGLVPRREAAFLEV